MAPGYELIKNGEFGTASVFRATPSKRKPIGPAEKAKASLGSLSINLSITSTVSGVADVTRLNQRCDAFFCYLLDA